MDAYVTHALKSAARPFWLMPVPRGGADSLRGGGRRPATSPDQAPVRKAPRPGAKPTQGAPVASRGPSSSSRASAPRQVTLKHSLRHLQPEVFCHRRCQG
eukprot:12092340-Alexandrium_andersonii.AAC.1